MHVVQFRWLQSNKIPCLFSIGLIWNVVKSDQTPNARTMTAVTILANTKNTVYTFAYNPNLYVCTSACHDRRIVDVQVNSKVNYTVSLVAIK
jgi:hypothetical protein